MPDLILFHRFQKEPCWSKYEYQNPGIWYQYRTPYSALSWLHWKHRKWLCDGNMSYKVKVLHKFLGSLYTKKNPRSQRKLEPWSPKFQTTKNNTKIPNLDKLATSYFPRETGIRHTQKQYSHLNEPMSSTPNQSNWNTQLTHKYLPNHP